MDVLTRLAAIARPWRRVLPTLRVAPPTRCVITLMAVCAIVLVVFLLVGPVPQPAAYHDFADQRKMLGMAHFWNVASNLPILLAGLAGLGALLLRWWRGDFTYIWLEAALWAVFFSAVSLTALGSTYYHLAPDSPRLFWDRLPLGLAAACLPAALLVERIKLGRTGLLALGAWLALGPLSVVVWDAGEAPGEMLGAALGGGDLRLYGLVQFGALVGTAAILLFTRASTSGSLYYWGALGCYLLAKFAELGDAAIFSAGGLLSGHTLKHGFAALAVALLGHMVNWRVPLKEKIEGETIGGS